MGRALKGKCASYFVGFLCGLTTGVYALDVSYLGAVKSTRYAPVLLANAWNEPP